MSNTHADPALHKEHAAFVALFSDELARAPETFRAVQSGSWFDPATWSTGRVPTEGANVVIGHHKSVLYDGVSDVALGKVRIDGRLEFATDRDSLMRVDTLLVSAADVDDPHHQHAAGALVIGTEDNPVEAGVDVAIRFPDAGRIAHTADDPGQLRHGLISHGTVSIHGAEKTPFLEMRDAAAGAKSIVVYGKPNGWQSGDKIVLTGTELLNHTLANDAEGNGFAGTQDEVVTIRSIVDLGDGRFRVTLREPLEFSHDAPRDDLHAKVANLSRNVTIESERTDPASEPAAANRGHVMLMHSDDIRIENAAFVDLGRTDKLAELDDRLIEANWQDQHGVAQAKWITGPEYLALTEDGITLTLTGATSTIPHPARPDLGLDDVANPRGRYAVHVHRAGSGAEDHAAEVSGSVVWGSPGWGFVSHDSKADFIGNVSFDVDGAHFVAETGNETGHWTGNIAIKASGFPREADVEFYMATHSFGQEGNGFWMNGRLIELEDNVAAGMRGKGFAWLSRGAEMIDVTADMLDHPEAANYKETIGADQVAIRHFAGNEAFASTVGMEIIRRGLQQDHDDRTHLSDFTAWEVEAGVRLDYTTNYLLSGFDLMADTDGMSAKRAAATIGVTYAKNVENMVLRDAGIDGFANGVMMKNFQVRAEVNERGQGKWFTDHDHVFIDVTFSGAGVAFRTYGETADIGRGAVGPASILNEDGSVTLITPPSGYVVDPVTGLVDSSWYVHAGNQLTAGQLVPGRLELHLDDASLQVGWGDTARERFLRLEGRKIDSIGEVDFPVANERIEIAWETLRSLLETQGYSRLLDGRAVLDLTVLFSDRATADVETLRFVALLDPEMPLAASYRYNGLYTLPANILDPDAAGYVYIPRSLIALDSFATRAADGTVLGGAAGDVMIGTVVDESLDGGDGDDRMEGAGGADTLAGGTGLDQLSGGTGDDLLLGGAGADALHGDEGNDIVLGGDDADRLTGWTGDDRLDGGAGEDVVDGGAGSDLLLGGSGADLVLGGDDADQLEGGDGEDELRGGAGDDVLFGDAGDDVLFGDVGSDIMAGGIGDDVYLRIDTGDVVIETADASGGRDTVQVLLNRFDLETAGTGVEVLEFVGAGAFEGQGNALANEIRGRAGNDTLDGRGGADLLIGGAGNDLYRVDDAGDRVIELASEGADTIQTGLAGYSLEALAEVENLVFTGTGAFIGIGNQADNRLDGGAGDDLLDGKAGDDRLAGRGGDDLYLTDSSADLVVEAADEGSDRVVTTAQSFTLATHVEALTFAGTGAFSGTGNAGDNLMVGGAGADTLRGLGGDDLLDGGAGADRLEGGVAHDTYIVDDLGDVVIELSGQGSDTIVALIDGFRLAADASVETLVIGTTSGRAIYGNGFTNRIYGNSGDDLLDGGGGTDTLEGGAGNDIYRLDGGDTVIEAAGGGIDTVLWAGTGNFSLAALGEVENATQTGSAGIVLTGNAGANILTGGGGADRLDGQAGADRLVGGAGGDTYVVDSTDDTVVETGPGGEIDTIETLLATFTLTAAHAGIERLRYAGTLDAVLTGRDLADTIESGDGADTLTGGGGDDRLSAGNGADTLLGGSGSDTLLGGAGNDLLDGGAGVDRMEGGTGNDRYIVDSLAELAQVIEAANAGTDVVELVDPSGTGSSTVTLTANLEQFVHAGSRQLVVNGNAAANELRSGSGNDRLAGDAGNDLLQAGAGNDTLEGGEGNDRALGEAGDDLLQGGGGNDTLDGGIGQDRLEGGAGNDVLLGGLGQDTLSGGDQGDVFVIDALGAANLDTIVDFYASSVGGVDDLDFSRLLEDGAVSAANAASYISKSYTGSGFLFRIDTDGAGSAAGFEDAVFVTSANSGVLTTSVGHLLDIGVLIA